MLQPELQLIEGKYEILRKLREGGMGSVYQVRHRLLDEVRVIKIIRPHLSSDEALRRRFLREARAAVRLRHPNIAQLYDFTVDAHGTAYMVMEFIDGEDLARLLKRHGPLAPRNALEIGIDALRAVSYLHRRHVVHRDISPDNLMLTRDVDGELLVKLIDLGIAKPLKSQLELTAQDLFLGKVRYTAPELLGGAERRAQVGPRSDLYSLGIVLYELVTGAHPIDGDSHESVIAGHLFHAPRDFAQSDPAGRVPEAVRAALLRSLEKQPQGRFADALEFSAALEAALADCGPGESADELLAGVVEPAGEGPEEPTSIQERLDREFGIDPTRPAPIAEIQPADVLCERVESLLAAGRLDRAEDELRRERAGVPSTPRLEALAERLAHARADAEQQLALAREQRDAGELDAALTTLDRAAERFADVAGLVELRSAIEQAIERVRRIELARMRVEAHLAAGERAEAARALARAVEKLGAQSELKDLAERVLSAVAPPPDPLAEAADAVAREIAADRLTEAGATLAEARRVHGAAFAPHADRLAERIERRRIELATRQARGRAAVKEQIAALAAGHDFAAALERLATARAGAPDDGELADLEREVRVAQLEAERRQKERDAIAARASALLEFGEHAAAGELLREAAQSYGDDEVLSSLRQRALAASEAGDGTAGVPAEARRLVDEAARLAASGDTRGAVDRLLQAQRLAPDDSGIASLLRAGERQLVHRAGPQDAG